ncbi:hypothetical protein E0Z06_13270 [Rheinheimera sp. D18]|uniref:hypothetical protein n=1 Tax=Rheinheimera sp. D18 TaxID=2545632 RepID=UPI00104EB28D|nr:hypothetical protein [Rheinheimera sp. D18]QBL10430.1 hypothetical protein E0Z06_13270 [Rheinheimera sp. D18]
MKRYLSAAIMAGLLTGCGGGSDSEPPVPALSLNISAPEVLDENSTAVIELNVANVKNSLSTELLDDSFNGAGYVSVNQLSPTRFELQVSETDRDRKVSLLLTVKDGTDPSRVISRNLQFNLPNSSFAAMLPEIKLVKAQQARLMALEEPLQLLPALQDAAIILNEGAPLPGWQLPATYEAQRDLTEQRFNALDIAAYEAGNLADSILINGYQQLMAELFSYYSPYQQEINRLLQQITIVGTATELSGQFYLDEQLGTVSWFVGNPQFGKVKDGQWQFHDEYRYLADLLSATSCSL